MFLFWTDNYQNVTSVCTVLYSAYHKNSQLITNTYTRLRKIHMWNSSRLLWAWLSWFCSNNCRLCVCIKQNTVRIINRMTILQTMWSSWQFPEGSWHSSVALSMLSVTHIMPILVINTCMDANMQLTINSFTQFLPEIYLPGISLTFPLFLVNSLTFPWQLSNSLTFPGFRVSNAMHGQNINLPVYVCVCVRHTFYFAEHIILSIAPSWQFRL